MSYANLPSEESLSKTVSALEENGFKVLVANNKEEAKKLALNEIPEGSEVMDNTSITLDETRIREEITSSGKYISLHDQALSMDREKEGKRIKEIRSVPDYAIGSFHAVTEDGHVLIASNTGSQLPGYAFGAENVVFVAGAQTVVKDISDGIKRIYEHSLPLESERARKAYGVDKSHVRRILIINSEATPRTTIILIKEVVGF